MKNIKKIMLLGSLLPITFSVSCTTSKATNVNKKEAENKTNEESKDSSIVSNGDSTEKVAKDNKTNETPKEETNNHNIENNEKEVINNEENKVSIDYTKYENAFILSASEKVGDLFDNQIKVKYKDGLTNNSLKMQIYGLRTDPTKDVRENIYLAVERSYRKGVAKENHAILFIKKEIEPRDLKWTSDEEKHFEATFNSETRILEIQYKVGLQVFTQNIKIENKK
ncbi:hypothetical protein [Mycoplasmopsis canis]|uniref:hypothetical protein n=1 Tax=Mycoplasmopsis canis TaxID=29555 RepID=UPI00025AEA32|nr:hypothetical protein [Mycoplasmopsis canis]EIE40722.1 hypothetical protein MCANUF33_01178 [Mycoplasmopsis canis UF33]